MPSFDQQPQFDKHGLPIPVKLEKRPYGFPADASATLSKSFPLLRYKKPLLALVILGVIGAILFPHIKKDIGKLLAIRHLRRSMEHIHRNRPELARRQVDQAAFWGGHHPPILGECARLRLESGDPSGCVRDCERLLSLNEVNSEQKYQALHYLANAHQRLRNWKAAIDTATRLIEMRPEEAEPWNVRAYMRALSGDDLEGGLADIENALRIHREQRINAHDRIEAFYLDTRGYLLIRLDQAKAGLADLQTAVEIVEEAQDHFLFSRAQFGWGRHARWEMRQLEESLAVIYHHRGEAYAALGEADKAAQDLERAVALGYDPQKGVE